MLSSTPGLLSLFRGKRVSLARCSLGIGTGLTLATGIREQAFPLPLDKECLSPSSMISSGRLKSQLGRPLKSGVLTSVVVAAEFFRDLGTVCSEPPIDLADPFILS
jgi:hypothetical protein